MALVHAVYTANKDYRRSHHSNPGFTNVDIYACATNSSVIERKLRRDPPIRCRCPCAPRENDVERRESTYSFSACDTVLLTQSKSYGVVEDTSSDPTNKRRRTYSGCRTMHDKGINVYVMPENIPELFLDDYNCNSKQNLEWSPDSEKACCQPMGPQSVTTDAPSSLHIRVDDESSFKENFENSEASQRERTVGVKRMRDESPSLPGSEAAPTIGEGKEVSNDTTLDMRTKFVSAVNGNASAQETTTEVCPPCKPANGFSNVDEAPISFYDVRGNIKCKRSKTLNADRAASLPCPTAECAVIDVISKSDHSPDTQQKQSVHTNETIAPNAVLGSQCVQVPRSSEELHPGLRKSLFPHVPPYIKFASHDEKAEQFPIHVHKLLRWKLSTITPLVVRKVVSNTGYRLLKKSTFWGGTWGKHTKSVGFKTLFDYQKMNHFPGSFQIGRKDRLWKSLQKLMFKHGKHKFDIMPTTYILPQDKRTLKLAWKKMDEKVPWIIKPPASARGTGIKVVHKWNQIPDNSPLIVQKYISNPYLINDTKFDLRLYVLVTSMNPLRIYLYDNGLVRFASVKYSTELSTLTDRYMHLTNYSINKLSSKYKQNEDATACQGHKWTLRTLWTYMKNELNVDVSVMWNKLIDLIIKTIISGESPITNLIDANLGSRYNSYELFGIDVLFDVDLKPWLLEVNISPSLHSASPLDLAVKAPLVRNLMNIAGFQIPCSKKFTEEKLCEDMGNVAGNKLCFDNRLYTRVLSYQEKQKHYRFARKSRNQYLNTILEDLTPDDVRHLIHYEDELTQLGSFQKIFPTSKTHEYLQYLDNPKYYNLLFDAWETKYHGNRQDGIRILADKCEEGLHLKIPKDTLSSSKTCETLPKCQQQEQEQQSQNNAFIENAV